MPITAPLWGLTRDQARDDETIHRPPANRVLQPLKQHCRVADAASPKEATCPWQATTGCAGFFTASAGSSGTGRPDRLGPRRQYGVRGLGRLGPIGKIEKQIHRTMSLGSLGPQGKREFTTGGLARAIYAHPTWDQDFRLRDKGAPPPKLKSWQYDRVRRAAPTFADRVGRSTGRGRPWLWRVRPDQYWWDVRRVKGKRTKE